MLSNRITRAMTVAITPAVLLLGACTDDSPVTPADNLDVVPALSKAAKGKNGRHVVVMKEGAVVDGLAAAVRTMGGTVHRSHDDIGVATVSGLTDLAVAEVLSMSDVEGVDEDVDVQWLPPRDFQQVPGPRTDQSGAFFFPQYQWNIRQIEADDAWLTTSQGAGSLVCILDSGIDPGHQDLLGKVDLSKSASFVASEPFIEDLDFHGTFVAALVASNGIAMASVAPDATLCAVKVLNFTGSGSFADVIAGIVHAADVGADAMNMSLGAYFNKDLPGGKELVKALERAVKYANSMGTLVVASAGNDAIDLDNDPKGFIHVPSQIKGVLSVGATAPIAQMDFDMLASYTNYGKKGVDIMAPGGDYQPADGGLVQDLVLSACSRYVCGADGFYLLGGGTSFAAPHVAGAAAVVAAQNGLHPTKSKKSGKSGKSAKSAKSSKIGKCLVKGADDLGKKGKDALYGEGRLNVLGAVRCKSAKSKK